MPQGGIDVGETPRQAVLRELAEETGTDKAEIIAESRDWYSYDLPPDLADRVWGGRYRGQRQKWFALAFTGRDSDIDLEASDKPEFSAWKWMPLAQLPRLIVPFKRRLYEAVAAEFADLAAAPE
jgi:putative (di)nucleoside polyphosphate hydrolase